MQQIRLKPLTQLVDISLTTKVFLLWLIPLVFYAVYLIYSNHLVVFPVYYKAGLHWLQGKPLYDGSGFNFVYFPPSAVMLSAFTYLPLPFKLVTFIYTIISVVCYAYAVCCFSKLAIANDKAESGIHPYVKYFLLMSLATIPLMLGTVKTNQIHPIIMALMMLALLDIRKDKLWRAALLLSLSIAIKPTALVVYLLVMCVYPRLAIKMLLTTLAIFALPFALQNPHYVWSQYLSCLHSFQVVSKYDHLHSATRWATIFNPLALVHIRISGGVEYAFRMGFSVLTLGFCFLARYKLSTERALIYIMTIAMCYLMLFNSRTEGNDYVMLVPFMGLFLMYMIEIGAAYRRNLLIVLIVSMQLSFMLLGLITPDNRYWLKPLAAAVFTVFLLYQFHLDTKVFPRQEKRKAEFLENA